MRLVGAVLGVGAQNAEAGAGHGGQGVGLGELVLPVAEEGEVVGREPAQQFTRLLDLLVTQIVGGRLTGQLFGDAQRGVAHLFPVLDGLADVREDPQQIGADLLEVGPVGLTVDLDMDPGFEDRVVRQVLAVRLEGQNFDQLAREVAADRDLRVDHDMDAAALAGQLVGDRVDEEGHVVGDHLDHGVAAGPAVLLDGRGVDPHVGRPLGAVLGEPEVGKGSAEDVDRVPVGQVLRSGVQVVALEVPEHGLLVRALAVLGPGRKVPPTGLFSATRAARASSSALASSSLVCMSSGSCRAPLRDVGERSDATP